MKQVIPGIYVETRYASGNIGLILTGAGIICVDVPMMPRDVEHWRAQMQKLTDEPIISIVQTDCDRERVISTCQFDVPVIAHEAAWDRMKTYRSDKRVQQIREMLGCNDKEDNWQVRMPDITFTERLVLNKGNQEVHLLHGGGHSPATTMVYLPEHRLIFAGDLVFNNMHPSMTQAQTKEWLVALNQLRKLGVDVIVPGHGEVCDKECTYPLSDYIREMRARVRRYYQANRSKTEISSLIITEFVEAFPYTENKRDAVRRRVKNASDRIYDEYRSEMRANVPDDDELS
ncbi:MAG: MBL fold metallo-hydrolase [Anaerolineae bacterium]|nr:MBL fold metallo-hydrolase [Anaerolineae bacterium]